VEVEAQAFEIHKRAGLTDARIHHLFEGRIHPGGEQSPTATLPRSIWPLCTNIERLRLTPSITTVTPSPLAPSPLSTPRSPTWPPPSPQKVGNRLSAACCRWLAQQESDTV